MRCRDVVIPYGGWLLEAQLAEPEHDEAGALAVLCHPHPLYGGTMESNVIASLFTGLVERARIATLRFNFSGVGRSGGQHEDGKGEVHQVTAALDHASQLGDWPALHAIGYSFGAAACAPAAFTHPRVVSFTGISFPFEFLGSMSRPALDARASSSIPALFLMGDQDDFTTVEAFHAWARKLSGEAVLVPGANHFLAGNETTLLDRITRFLEASAP